jgi:hypothetical protein
MCSLRSIFRRGAALLLDNVVRGRHSLMGSEMCCVGRTAGLTGLPMGSAVGRPAGGSALFESSQESSTKATNSLVGITSESTFDFVGVRTPYCECDGMPALACHGQQPVYHIFYGRVFLVLQAMDCFVTSGVSILCSSNRRVSTLGHRIM